MDDLYYRYGATADGGSVSRPRFPGYFSSEAPPSTSHHALGAYDLQGASSDFLQRDTLQPGAYGLNDVSDIGARPEARMNGLTGVANANGFLGDSNLVSQRQNLAPGIGASIPDALNERSGAYGSNFSGIGVHPEPVISGVTGIATAKGYPLPLGDSNLVSQRHNLAPGIGASFPDALNERSGAYGANFSGIGVHPEPVISGVTGIATAKGYPLPLGDSNLVSQRHNLAPGIGASIPDALNERPGAYGSNASGIGVHPEPVISGVTGIASAKGYPSPSGDSNLLSQRRNPTPGISADIPDAVTDRPSSLKNADDLSAKESNIIFVGGLPTDCTRREVGHLFRPFIGYKDIKVIHKEARRSEDRAMVLCFVEFTDSKYALTAMEALQGYKVDDKKANSPSLRIQFAHFPFRLPSDHDEPRIRFP
ncbi:uncharacterized protein LOC119992489 isoform X2 [Tripterygium wilfordii]|uniref:uncharacterized protein LOC119992489 isoform X2 n=1 Tax=Tripterygium wilfordii TaxID=458696 RepID=UPI0018F7F18C|nr:uncharacterized protein LOC119992489 isoform X2 [Tripterygium wilfordii]